MGEVLRHLAYLIVLVVAAAAVTLKYSRRILNWLSLSPWTRWLGKALAPLVVAALLFGWPAEACAQIQSIDTLWRHDSTATIDSSRTVVQVDTVYSPWQIDTTWRQDSTIARIDTVFTPQPPTAGACPNEPAGWTLVNVRHYTPADRDWGVIGAFSLASDPTAPDGDGSVGRMFYSATGRRVGSATMSSAYTPTLKGKGYRGLYTCYWQKMDAGFQLGGGGAQGSKQFWFLVGPSAGHGENRIIIGVDGKSPDGFHWGIFPTRVTIAVQGLGNVVSSPWNGGAVSRGQWYRVEVLGQLESAKGATDGYLKLYVNGVLVRTMPNLQFTWPGEPLEWFGFKWNNTIGGGAPFCTTPTFPGGTYGGKVYPPNNGVLPTQAQYPECFYPVNASIYMDAQRVLAH